MNTPCSPAEHGVLLLRPRARTCSRTELAPRVALRSFARRARPPPAPGACPCLLFASCSPFAAVSRVARDACAALEVPSQRSEARTRLCSGSTPRHCSSQTASAELDERPARRRQTRPPLLHLMGCVTSLSSSRDERQLLLQVRVASRRTAIGELQQDSTGPAGIVDVNHPFFGCTGCCGAPPMASAHGAAPARIAGRMHLVIVQENEEHELGGCGESQARGRRRRLAHRAAGAGARAEWDG